MCLIISLIVICHNWSIQCAFNTTYILARETSVLHNYRHSGMSNSWRAPVVQGLAPTHLIQTRSSGLLESWKQVFWSWLEKNCWTEAHQKLEFETTVLNVFMKTITWILNISFFYVKWIFYFFKGFSQVEMNRYTTMVDYLKRIGNTQTGEMQGLPVMKSLNAFHLFYRFPKCAEKQKITGKL